MEVTRSLKGGVHWHRRRRLRKMRKVAVDNWQGVVLQLGDSSRAVRSSSLFKTLGGALDCEYQITPIENLDIS